MSVQLAPYVLGFTVLALNQHNTDDDELLLRLTCLESGNSLNTCITLTSAGVEQGIASGVQYTKDPLSPLHTSF